MLTRILRVSVGLIRSSSLVSVRVRDANKQDACAIATETGWHFAELRKGLGNSELRQRLGKIDKEIRDQEDKVEERRKILRTILKNRDKADPERIEWNESDGSDTNEESPEDSMKRGLESQTEGSAIEDLEVDLRHLSELNAQRARILASLEKGDETVLLHQLPQVAEVPVWPDIPFNLSIGIGLGAMLSPVLTWWYIRRQARRATGCHA